MTEMHPCLSSAVWSPERLQVTAFASLGKWLECSIVLENYFYRLDFLVLLGQVKRTEKTNRSIMIKSNLSFLDLKVTENSHFHAVKHAVLVTNARLILKW